MKYLLHDTNALQDEKMTQLFLEYGYEGIGLFWSILEKIAFQEKPINTGVLKSQLRIGKRLEKCFTFIQDLGLISVTNDETFNERILSYSEKYQIQKQKNRERISEWRENQKVEKNVTRYEQDCNSPKVKRSKVKVYNRAKALGVSVETPEEDQKDLSEKYDAFTTEISTLEPIKIWEGIKSFIIDSKPHFINPYVDLWNIFADRNNLSKVQQITESRKKKFSTRIKEEPFDFITILSGIKKSNMLLGKSGDWKVSFDWILENEKNYIKIMEGQYS